MHRVTPREFLLQKRLSAFYDRARSSLASKRAGNLIAPLGDTRENVRIHSYTWPRPALAANRNFERSRPDPRPRLELTLVWVGFIGTLAVILWIAFTWTALHK